MLGRCVAQEPADRIARTMASKPSTRSAAPRAPRGSLKATDVPGVYKNRAGLTVDENGVALSFKDIKKRDDARFTEVLGKTAETPLDIIEGVARDPRYNMMTRLDAAVKAAPYRHAKLVAVQGVAGAPPIGIQAVENMDKATLSKYEELLKQALDLATKNAAGE